jgi:hypothetical protein
MAGSENAGDFPGEDADRSGDKAPGAGDESQFRVVADIVEQGVDGKAAFVDGVGLPER